MLSTSKDGPQYPAQGGAKISGTQPTVLWRKALWVVWLLASLVRMWRREAFWPVSLLAINNNQQV